MIPVDLIEKESDAFATDRFANDVDQCFELVGLNVPIVVLVERVKGQPDRVIIVLVALASRDDRNENIAELIERERLTVSI